MWGGLLVKESVGYLRVYLIHGHSEFTVINPRSGGDEKEFLTEHSLIASAISLSLLLCNDWY